MSELQAALVGYADWLGYGHGERAEAWLRRLEINAPELARFRGLVAPSCAPYRAVPTPVLPAEGIATRVGPALRTDAEAALARAKSQPQWNAFTWLADSAPAHGSGILAGVPVVVKDLVAVAGRPLSGGSAAGDAVPAARDAEVVARLRRAGASLIGLSNLHEWAYGITSDNPRFGRVVNPAAPARIPGGSSGGSAAAVAAGIVELTLGTDTAGSIRIPSACCGIVGFKPSYDAVPRTGGVDLAGSLDHIGPMCRTVDACAAMFAAMLDLPAVPRWTWRDLAGRRIARRGAYFEQPRDPQERAALDAAAAVLAGDGARLSEATIEGIDDAPAIQFVTIAPEASEVHLRRLAERGPDISEEVRVRLEIGQFIPGAWYVKAQRLRRQLADAVEALFESADFLLCPTLRTPAPAVGARDVDIGGRRYPLHTAVTQLTLPWNLTGLPAITVPWSTSRDGVPIGLQIVGRRGADWAVLAAGQRLEALR
jgi:Asp-tRNA(Asn)/Glu-tRNA(Gln) amidotransferase A subunit family amidase